MFDILRDLFMARRNTKPSHSLARPRPEQQSDDPSPAATPANIPYPRDNLPRLYVSGRFYNDPPTINNLVSYYDTDRFRPSYQLTTDEINFNGAFCPKGTGTFAFVDCKVDGSYSPNATSAPQNSDSLIGQVIDYSGRSVYGKLVDLDPQFQDVFTLYGSRIIIGNGKSSFTALLLPAPSRNWWEAIENPEKDGKAYNKGAAATFQGILKIEDINYNDSTFLEECRPYLLNSAKVVKDNQQLYPKGALSIRFSVDSYSNDYTAADFCYGNLSAYITPWLSGYPTSFDAGREIYPTSAANISIDGKPSTQVANVAHATLERKGSGYNLCVDFINSFYRTKPMGTGTGDSWESPYLNQGELKIGYVCSDVFQSLATIDYTSEDFVRSSCVVDVPLNEDAFTALGTSPLVIQSTSGGNVTIPLKEADDGLFVSADCYLYRLEGSDELYTGDTTATQYAELYCSKFGVIQQKQPILVGLDSTLMQTNGQRQGGGPVVGKPESALVINGQKPVDDKPDDFVTTITTAENGIAKLSLTGGNCNNHRGYIDGQVYGLRYTARSSLEPASTTVIGNEKINILLFDVFKPPTDREPCWLVDILPIFQQYANLYPSMDRVVRLDDYSSVMSRKEALKRVFSAPVDSGEYMPTKRDLSDKKKAMILTWLDNPAYIGSTTTDLQHALQAAVEIEHSTMPPYLTALYTIKPGYNSYIANTLREVAMEEMMHMSISCNIMIALGWHPTLNTMGIVPKYPGPLPGGVCEGLIVRLRKCTKQQIKVFQTIESPDQVEITEDGTAETGNPVQENEYTIGWIYTHIAHLMETLHAAGSIQFPNDCSDKDAQQRRDDQVIGPFKGKLNVINSLKDAVFAIQTIKDQGEGISSLNPTDDGTELAHYYRFAEIVRGRRLTVGRTSEDKLEYSFNGPPIVINPEGVYNMQDDPKIELQPIDSQQRERMNSFARKYQSLLNGLHTAFNGHADYFEKCYGLMFQLTMAAQPLMEMPALDEDGVAKSDGTTCGISFQMPIDEVITYHVEPNSEPKADGPTAANSSGCK